MLGQEAMIESPGECSRGVPLLNKVLARFQNGREKGANKEANETKESSNPYQESIRRLEAVAVYNMITMN